MVIKKSPRLKVGFQVYLAFYITQHTRDEVLMRIFIHFFACGSYKTRSNNKDAGDFYCINLSNVQLKKLSLFLTNMRLKVSKL